MADQALYLRHLRGVECLETFLAMISNSGIGEWNYISIATNVEMLTASEGFPNGPKLKWVRDTLAANPEIDCVSIMVQQQNGMQIKYITDDYIVARIVISPNNPQNHDHTARQMVSMLGVVRSKYKIVPRGDLVQSFANQEEKLAIRHYEMTAAELTEAVKKLGIIAAEQIAKSQNTLNTKLADLETAYENKRADLEKSIAERRTALEAEYTTRNLSLEQREQALKTEREQFDLRANTAVRRELFEKVKDELAKQSEAQVSKLAAGKRWPVHTFCITVLVLSGAAAGFLMYHLATANQPQAAWPLTITMLAFAGVMIFYLRFIYQWFAELAGAEFTTKKLTNDFLRASWIAELFLESKQQGQTELPPELLLQFTKNLFTDFDWKHRVQHPMEQVIDGLTRAKRIKASPTEVEVSR